MFAGKGETSNVMIDYFGKNNEETFQLYCKNKKRSNTFQVFFIFFNVFVSVCVCVYDPYDSVFHSTCRTKYISNKDLVSVRLSKEMGNKEKYLKINAYNK